MKRQLLLLRHAKSDWEAEFVADFERPLAKRGKKAARRIANWMKDAGIFPEHVICSPAVRTRKTLARVSKVLDLNEAEVEWADSIYEAEPQALLETLQHAPANVKSLMLVGHNPGLELLIEDLAVEAPTLPADGKLMPAGALAVLETESAWRELTSGCAEVLNIVRPRDLQGAD